MPAHASPVVGHVNGAHRTASVLLLRNVYLHARSVGVDADAVLRALRVSPSVLEDRDARFPIALIDRAWAAFTEASHDDAFGLHAAQSYDEGAFDVVEWAASFGNTVGAVIDRLARFHRLISDSAAVEIRRDAAVTRVVRLIGGTHPQDQDSFFATLCARLRTMSGAALAPKEVSFEHSAHAARELEAFFRCPVRFGRARSELVFASSDLDQPVLGAKPRLAALLDRYADDLLARLPATESYVDRVRRCIALCLHDGPPTLEAIARRMHASPRTVQRRLNIEGTTPTRLVEEVRRPLALRYIESPKLSITEIAFLLGYSDEGSFRRSFKKWTGKSPSEVRRQELLGTRAH